jgi:DNA-binding response OmpR family regulator
MGRRILIADDEKHIRRILVSILERAGHEVTAVENAEDAFRHALNEEVDAVIMDLNMPGLNGIEGIRSIRMVKAELPILVLTGYTSDRICTEAAEAGANHCLFKPAKAQEIVDEINALLGEAPAAEADDESGGPDA